jgi:Tfp pilus assembly protein PilF
VGLIRLGKIDQAEKTLQGWPADALFHCRLAEALAEHGEAEKAIGHYHEALSLEPQFADVLNNLAWLLATWHEPKFRNGTEAIKLAEQVVNLAKQTAYVGTLAAAYAEAGQFPKAIETVEKARAMAVSAGQTELATWNQKLLELYRSGQPYHEIDPSKKTARAPN